MEGWRVRVGWDGGVESESIDLGGGVESESRLGWSGEE